MATTRFHQVNTAREAVEEQRRWIQMCGGDKLGYVIRYGSANDPNHFGDGGEAIFDADFAELYKREQRLLAVRGEA